MYHNNIADLFADAVAADYSIVYSLISGSKVTEDAEILDGLAPGVYLVRVSLAK